MFSKLVRIGKSAEMATTTGGKQVMKMTCAYDVGFGDNKKTVWCDCSWWGNRGEKVAQYLTKGLQVVVHADDVEPDAYQGANGLSVKLKLNLTNIELVARAQGEQSAPQQQRPQAQPSPNAVLPNANDFDFSDSIPF
jgi:single-strand DNA-binding protein